jgi:hypothetical protein
MHESRYAMTKPLCVCRGDGGCPLSALRFLSIHTPTIIAIWNIYLEVREKSVPADANADNGWHD